jgi:HEAT repeat protein
MRTFWSMRYCSKLLLLFLFARAAIGAGTNAAAPVFHSSIKAASEAAADQSLVLVVFRADSNEPSKELKARTLDSREFNEQAGALHIAEVDAEAEAGTARDYGVTALPTLVLLTADSKLLGRRTGFLYTAELMLWLREARARAKEGKWEGIAPSPKLAEFIDKAGAGGLDTNDLARLIVMLGEPEPADRDAAASLLTAQREEAVAPLIGAVTNSYLGVRIAASELLHRLAPAAPAVDPWQAPAALAETVTALRKWWANTGRLPAQEQEQKIDPASAAAVGGALEALRGDDPARRTAAMSTLVAAGPATLPAVRDAIKAGEKTGDQRSLALLEDVRWAILIPDEVEQRATGARAVLARGKGAERQSVAARLGRAGRPAIPALAELLNDADPLVVESAVRALSGIGEKDAIPAMAALLKAPDSNLRMTAAQALGHAKNNAAVKDLLTVFDDPNEVVACTALSALEEINAAPNYSSTKKAQPPEVGRALKGCLADPRWRVRAAAAEIAGKLEAKELIPDLKTLLEDADGFVIKNALEALRKMSAMPEPDKLLAIAQRQAGLRGEAVEMLVNSGSEPAVQAVIDLYKTSNVEGRLTVLGSLKSGHSGQPESTAWQPFLTQAATETDPRLRRAVADVLGAQPAKVAAAVVDPLLADEDTETRSNAAAVVLSVIGQERAVARNSHGNINEMLELMGMQNSTGRQKPAVTNEPPTTPKQIAAWHAVLQQKAGATPDALTAAAIYVTGQSNVNLPVLQGALDRADKEVLATFSQSAALAAIIPRLPWPDGKPVVERLCRSPAVFMRMIGYSAKAAPGLRDFLFVPAYFRAAVEPASLEELETTLPQWLGSERKPVSPLSGAPHTEPLLTALLDATNAAWRAAAVYVVGSREDDKGLAHLQRALKDTNGWVRAAAIPGLMRTAKDRATLEQRLGPLMADPDKAVAAKATVGLLEPETRSAAGLDYSFEFFQFEKIHAFPEFRSSSGEQRPLAPLSGNPAFLEQVRRRVAESPPQEAALPALLLAQYGDFSGLDRLLPSVVPENAEQSEVGTALLAAIGMSRDSKYLPYLKQITASSKGRPDLNRMLQAIKGMSGPEARELRLEINRRMRQGEE